MAALDFPASPSSGQRYSANGSTWEWNGSAWIKLATTSGPTDRVTTTNDTSTAALYPVMVDGAGDNKELKLSTSKLKFDASAGGLTVTGTSGEVTAGVGNTALIVDGDARVLGILTVGSGTVKIDSAGVTATGVATFTNFKTGTTNVHNVGVEAAGINVLGADTPIGTGATVYNSGLIVSKSGGEYQGVVTASTFKGAVEGNVTGNINGTTGTFSGDVSIGGVLTYEDVKNVDAIGIVTAREGVFIPDTKELKLGNTAASPDLKLYSTGTNGWVYTHQSGADLYMGTNEGEVYIQTGTSGNDTAIKVNSGGSVELNHSTNKKLHTFVNGVTVTGNLYATNAVFVDDSSDAGNSNYIGVGLGKDLRLWHNGSENHIRGTGDHPIIFSTNGASEKLRITSAGLVGINTAIPSKQLEVQGLDVALRLKSTVATGRIGMEFYDTAAQKGFLGYPSSGNDNMSLQQNEAADLYFYVNGGTRLNIKSTGQVRIDGPTAAAHGLRFTPNGWNSYDNRMGYCGSSGADFWWSSNWNPTDGARDHSGYATNYIRQNISNGYISFGTGAVNASATERFRIDDDGNVYFSGSQSGNNRGIIYNHAAGFGIYASADSSTDRNIKFYSNSSSGSQKFAILANGVLQHTPTGGPSTFNSTSEYVFGSATSSPSSGGAEANFQIHAAKTRAQFSVNAYMNNAGGPFMQFISSRSGTVGTLGTKCQNNDYLGEIRFLGDNGTNSTTLCQGASIYAQAASTPADGDTTIAGELYFVTGTASGGTQPVRVCIDSAGRLTMNECGRVGNAKALRMKCDNDTTSTASTDRSGSNSYKNSAIIIEKGISNGNLVGGLIDAWDGSIHATSIGIIYDGSRYHTSIGVNNDTNDRPIEIMRISGNKTVKIGGGVANIAAGIGLEIGGDGATSEIRLKNSGGGTGSADGFAIQKWSNGNNYIYDYDSNNILFGTGNLSRTSMDTLGRWCFSPGPSLQTASSVFTMSLIHEGNFSGTGIYPGIAMKSTDTGGGDGMSIHAFDANWDLYARSGNRDGISIANDAMTASSGYSRVCIGGDGAITMGKSVYDHLTTSRYCHTALHVAGGSLSIGAVSNHTRSHRAGVYTLGWYTTHHANASYYHIKTDLWAGGSPHGNNEYIMGGFRIEGYSYSSPTGSATAWVQFHNWNGGYPGLTIKSHYSGWNMDATVYTSSDGYVVLRLAGGTYKGHVIDLIQHTIYESRNIGVASFAQNNNSTHF